MGEIYAMVAKSMIIHINHHHKLTKLLKMTLWEGET